MKSTHARRNGQWAAICLLMLLSWTVDSALASPSATADDRVSDQADPRALPCIPLWARESASPMHGSGDPAWDDGSRVDYQTQIEFAVTSDVFGVWMDEAASLTRVYSGDYSNDRVVEHNIDPGLAYSMNPLPIPYGQSWLAADLDLDGHVEIILQRGDTGMGGNGHLDIHSAPDWQQRAHIVLAGMKVYFYPVAANIDKDPYLELYLTPSSLGGVARAMIVDYDPVGGGFILSHNISTPANTGGATAAGDFDQDGRFEFITGNSSGYGLFEHDATGLYYRGTIEGSFGGTWASAVRPKPDGTLYALLGGSSFDQGYRYQLRRPTGDNTFAVETTFQEITGWAGIHPSHPLDADCDGLDEFTMNFYPMTKVYEWDAGLNQFQSIWSWDQAQTGTFVQWGDADCDQDQVREWCCVNHTNLFRAYEDRDASSSGIHSANTPRIASAITAAPNPFRAGVTIGWAAAAGAQQAALSVYDAQGRLVRTWNRASAYTGSGPTGDRSHTLLTWDGCDLTGQPVTPGVYFLRLEGTRGYLPCRLTRVR